MNSKPTSGNGQQEERPKVINSFGWTREQMWRKGGMRTYPIELEKYHLTFNQVKVFAYILHCLGKTRKEARASIRKIANKTGISKITATRSIDVLKSNGLISKRSGLGRTSSAFRIIMALDATSERQAVVDSHGLQPDVAINSTQRPVLDSNLHRDKTRERYRKRPVADDARVSPVEGGSNQNSEQ